MKKLAVGIDIGGTNTLFGVVDSEGNMWGEGGFSTQAYPDIDLYLKHLHDGVNRLITEIGGEVELIGIGVGAPNANRSRGTVEGAPNLPWGGGVVPIVAKMEALFEDVPVHITNDAKAATLGEMMFGGARGMSDFIVITLGTGVGGGFVANGELIYGSDDFAGEIGHITIEREGRVCGCGRMGCLEAYVSASGIKQTALELLAGDTHKSALKELSQSQLTAKSIAEFADRGDLIAIETYRQTGVLLGETLAKLVAITSPEAIFILGGVANAGRWIFEPTQKHMELNLLPIYRNRVKVRPSAITSSNGAIMGASSLAWGAYTQRC